MIGHSILAAGQVCIPPAILRSIREEIVDNGDLMAENIAAAEDFRMDYTGSLKRLPKGFEKETEHTDLLRLKDHCLVSDLTEEEVLSEDFVPRMLERFRSAKPYLDQLNRAIEYGYEEYM